MYSLIPIIIILNETVQVMYFTIDKNDNVFIRKGLAQQTREIIALILARLESANKMYIISKIHTKINDCIVINFNFVCGADDHFCCKVSCEHDPAIKLKLKSNTEYYTNYTNSRSTFVYGRLLSRQPRGRRSTSL